VTLLFSLFAHASEQERENLRCPDSASRFASGIPADYQQALVWEKKAAQRGDREAQRDLAFMYEQGFGVPADPQEAMFWNRRSAQQGAFTSPLWRSLACWRPRPSCFSRCGSGSASL
jgi:TPR repeat protein